MHAPLVQMTSRNPKLAGEISCALPRDHPLDRRKLELSAEDTALSLGHRSPLENCPLFLCLNLGGHSIRYSLFIARLRIISGKSAGIGIGGVLPIRTALVTEFSPRRIRALDRVLAQ
jgi:hypothetical protein